MLQVPVIPIYFHGSNSMLFNLLGVISWQLRTLRLPSEVFRKKGAIFHVSVGDIITPEEISKHEDLNELGEFLKKQTYSLKKRYK